jgi:hypothetical protein
MREQREAVEAMRVVNPLADLMREQREAVEAMRVVNPLADLMREQREAAEAMRVLNPLARIVGPTGQWSGSAPSPPASRKSRKPDVRAEVNERSSRAETTSSPPDREVMVAWLKQKLKQRVEPLHVRLAKELIYQLEPYIQLMIDVSMASVFGQDWENKRLDKCDCATLIGRSVKMGKKPIYCADFYQYKQILTHPEHYELVFKRGFNDPVQLENWMETMRKLRGLSHHTSDFTVEHFEEMQNVFNSLVFGVATILHPFRNDIDLI